MKIANMEERVCYSEIKRFVLDGFYSDCRTRGHGENWTYDAIIAVQYDDSYYRGESYERELNRGLGSFSYPVEYFMFEVVFLTLAGSWSPKQSTHYRQQIVNILKFHTLESMLSGISDDERMEFELDLKGLGLLDEHGELLTVA